MTESWIDIVRRRIREGEERLRKAPSGKLRAEATIPEQLELPAAEPLLPPADRALLIRSKTGIVAANFEQVSASADHGDLTGKNFEAARDWSAYGQMTPGRMEQLSHFIAASVCDIADHIRSRQSIWAAEPALTKLLLTIDRTRRTLEQWYESAQSLPRPAQRLRVGDLLGAALAARKPELNRWGVEAAVHCSEMAAEDSLCPPELFTAVLHILQACIEELRESEGKRRLDIQVPGTGEHMEVAFVYDLPEPGTPETHTAGGVASMDYPSTNMELRAAQKLLESMGGTLVLENLAPHQRAIRMRLNIGVLASGNSELQIEKEEGAN